MPCAYHEGGSQPEAGHFGSLREERAVSSTSREGDPRRRAVSESGNRAETKIGFPMEENRPVWPGRAQGGELVRTVLPVTSGLGQAYIFRDKASGGKCALWKVSSSLPLRGIYERSAYRSQKAG